MAVRRILFAIAGAVWVVLVGIGVVLVTPVLFVYYRLYPGAAIRAIDERQQRIQARGRR
jgi:F0F1-type ATP synthase membrane subunit b/b'